MKRTSFLAASASLVAAAGAPAVAGVPGGSQFVERRANFDAAAFAATLNRPAGIRQLWEAVAFNPKVLSNIKNSFNGLQFGFGFPPNRILMALAGHGASSSYGYADAIWAKYRIGEFFGIKDAAGTAIASNVFYPAKSAYDPSSDPDDPAGTYQDTSLQTLQKRGLVVLTCHTAVEEQARALVKAGNAPAGMTPSDVADDILTHLVPGAVVVPAMVAAIAVLQHEYGYAYTTLAL
jgi:intracellular sulfur oxidation DsrE/DsrF family protein